MLSHHGLLRGENIRNLELANMFSQVLDGEGFQNCMAMVFLIQHAKTNAFGMLQHVGFMRNKNVEICPIGAAALYLFDRFHCDHEPFPTFNRSQDRYDIKFLRGRDRLTSISYVVYKKSYENMFGQLGLTFNNKNHVNRQQGARHLESADVDISQTRRHGRRGMDTCEGVYSAPLAREAMRALSGHPPRSRLYYLKRAVVEPSESLQRQMFPEVELWLERIMSGTCETNLAARGFLELLQIMRSVILQDCAFLYDLLPVRMRGHAILGPEFQAFRESALGAAQTHTDPVENQLQVAMPFLAQQLTVQYSSISDTIKTQHDQGMQIVQWGHNQGIIHSLLVILSQHLCPTLLQARTVVYQTHWIHSL